MGMVDKMMGMMMGKMSKEEKNEMMDKMMDKMMGDFTKEEKMEMMMTMMPKMMENMDMMEMMPQMMSMMMEKMGSHDEGSPMHGMMMQMMPVCFAGLLHNTEREKAIQFADKMIKIAIEATYGKTVIEEKDKIKEHIATLLN